MPPPNAVPSLSPHVASASIKNVAVFCASAAGSDPVYCEAATGLGRALATRNIGVVYGGATVGLMSSVAEAALAAGGRVIGVIPTVLVDLEVAHDRLTELHVTDTMHTQGADRRALGRIHRPARRLWDLRGAVRGAGVADAEVAH